MNERLKFFINFLKERRTVVSDAEFARLTGKQRSYVSEIISGKRTLSEQYVLKIVDTFNELNKDWLLTGNGEMLKENIAVAPQPSPDEMELYKKLIASLEETVASQKIIIQKLQAELIKLQRASLHQSDNKIERRAASAIPPDMEPA